MIINCVIGQAGSGKSTFIEKNFLKEEYIFFNVGKILRGMFDCMKGAQDSKNVWDFANPLVYGTLKHCMKISKDSGYDLVLDGFPRNSSQLSHLDRHLSEDFGEVSVVIHVLNINKEEQVRRVEKRNGKIDEYQLSRIDQSRSDFEYVLDELARVKEKAPERLRYVISWYDQIDGDFVLSREIT